MRRWSLRLALLASGLVVPLLLVEIAMRLFGPFLPGTYSTGTFLTTHPVYGRFHVPGFDGWVKSPEFTSRVSINSLGLRGPEQPYEKRTGVTRILVLGDSFVEAAQVDQDHGVVSRLEAALNEAGSGPHEVLNGGVGGWGTGQEYIYLASEGYRYTPDLVLVALYLGNDVYDNSYVLQGRPRNPHEPYFVVQPDGSLRQLDFTVRRRDEANPILPLLRSRLLLWNVFETGVLFKLGYGDGDPEELRQNRFNLNKMLVHANTPNERIEDAWRVTLAILGRVRDFARERGFEAGVVVVPAAWQVYETEWDELLRANNLRRAEWSPGRPNRFLAERQAEIGMPVLDLLPAFRREAERSERLYYPADKHWTSAGHALATREIEAWLASRGLVSASRAGEPVSAR